MFVVKVYDVFNNTHEFPVKTVEQGREYAKRIVVEGLWLKEDGGEVFYPVHQIVKVKVVAKAGDR